MCRGDCGRLPSNDCQGVARSVNRSDPDDFVTNVDIEWHCFREDPRIGDAQRGGRRTRRGSQIGRYRFVNVNRIVTAERKDKVAAGRAISVTIKCRAVGRVRRVVSIAETRNCGGFEVHPQFIDTI